MPLIPLLPKTKGPEWPPQAELGLHSLSDLDYQRNLGEDYHEASDYGTPSPWAYPIVFAQRLRLHLEDREHGRPPRFGEEFRCWAALVKGLYLQVLKLRPVRFADLGAVGRLLAVELPEGFGLGLVSYETVVVGLTHPDIGPVPSVRLDEPTLIQIEERIAKDEKGGASDYFRAWVEELQRTRDPQQLFIRLLVEAARSWPTVGLKSLPRDLGRVFGPGPKLDLRRADDQLEGLELPAFVGAPIVCGHCGHEIAKSREGHVIHKPEDCRCPNCQEPFDWLAPHAGWVRYSEQRGEYLIYAFGDSPMRAPDYGYAVTEEADGVVIESGRFALRVVGLVLSETRLKCNRLIFFRDGDLIRRPDLPVRGEYFGLVHLARSAPPRTDSFTQEYVVTLEVDDWEPRVVLRYAPDEIRHEEALLLVWPNFQLEGWNAYYYLLEAPASLNRAGIKLRGLRGGAEPQLLEGDRGRATTSFEALEIVFVRGDAFEQAGVYTPLRTRLRRGQSPVTLALDFGTSSSAIWFRMGDTPPRVLRFVDFTDTLVPNRLFAHDILQQSNWLPTYRIDDRDTALEAFRRQLAGESTMDLSPEAIVQNMNCFLPAEVMRTGAAGNRHEPLRTFRICHPYGARPEAEPLYELKSMPAEGDPRGGTSFSSLVASYLEMWLVLALASIVRQEERAGYLIVRATFPRAFPPAKVRLYREILESVRREVEALTGFVTNELYTVDESRAAAHSMPTPGHVSLVMDMGGGTTDIGVFERQRGQLRPLYIDSLQYGGNDYLRLLIAEPGLFPRPTEKEEHRLLWLLREIRLRSFREVVRTQYAGNQQGRQRAVKLLVHFYRPVLYFVRRLFEALPFQGRTFDLAKDRIALYLAGNAWVLAEAIPLVDPSFHGSYHQIIAQLMAEEGFGNLTVAQQPVPARELVDWPGPKAAVGYGALMAPQEALYRDVTEALAEEAGIRSVVGFDIEIDDGSNGRARVDWHRPVPHALATNHARPLLEAIGQQLPPAWSFIEFQPGREVQMLEQHCAVNDIRGVGQSPHLCGSVLARFIEQIYLHQLKRAVSA